MLNKKTDMSRNEFLLLVIGIERIMTNESFEMKVSIGLSA